MRTRETIEADRRLLGAYLESALTVAVSIASVVPPEGIFNLSVCLETSISAASGEHHGRCKVKKKKDILTSK
jgi:hypothetical protein